MPGGFFIIPNRQSSSFFQDTEIHLDLHKTGEAMVMTQAEKKNHVTASCSLDYLKSETVQHNCISTQLKTKYEIIWLWVKTNASQTMFCRAFIISRDIFCV